MEHLWAPWRNLYVKDSQKNEANIFAGIAQGSDDEGHFVLARGKGCFAILNVYPYNTGHLMIIPYRATGALEDLSDDELLELMTMLKRMKAAVTAAFQPETLRAFPRRRKNVWCQPLHCARPMRAQLSPYGPCLDRKATFRSSEGYKGNFLGVSWLLDSLVGTGCRVVRSRVPAPGALRLCRADWLLWLLAGDRGYPVIPLTCAKIMPSSDPA